MKNLVNLDRTLDLSVKIMNGEVDVPQNIDVSLMFGGMNEFKFKGSEVSIPIEHIGLAILANNYAMDQFMVKRITDLHTFTSNSLKLLKGNIAKTPDVSAVEKVFEPINHKWGVYIADFLKSFEPEVLNWYTKPTGQKLTFEYFDNHVMRPNYVNYKKTATNDDVAPRIDALREGFNNALNIYLKKEAQFCEKGIQKSELNVENSDGEKSGVNLAQEGKNEDFKTIEEIMFNERLQQLVYKAQTDYEASVEDKESVSEVEPKQESIGEVKNNCKIIELKFGDDFTPEQ